MGKAETPATIWNELIDKELTDVDIEGYAERLRKAREIKKSSRNDRSAKIITAEKKEDTVIEEVDNSDESKIIESDDKKSEVIKQKKKTEVKEKKKRDTSRDELATKIGAFVFFGIFGVIQLWLLIDWIIKGCLIDTLALHLLPVIIAGSLFIVTSLIDLVNIRKNKREEAKKSEVVNKLNRSTKKKGGKHK